MKLSNFHYSWLMLWLMLISIAAWSPVKGYAAPSPGLTELPGLIPTAEVESAQVAGRLDKNETISITLVLAQHNKADADNLLHRLYDPNDPAYGHYITTSEFVRRFSPTQSEYAAVIKFAVSHGLSIIATHDNRLLLDVTGQIAVVEATFGTTLLRYRSPTGREFYAPNTNPKIPTLLQGHLLGIIGLDNATVRHPYNHSSEIEPRLSTSVTGSGPYGGLTPGDISRAYGLSGSYLTGFGQSLGLFELDGYNSSDISKYESVYGLPNVPLHNVLIDGVNGQPGTGDGPVEVTLDIELQIALAPNIDQIVVYEGPNNDMGVLDTYNRIADDNIAKEVSTSWGSTEKPGNQFLLSAEDSIFRQMAIQGQTICAAAGDNGAYDDKQALSVDDPASQPHVLGVGGTSLFTNGPGGNYAHESAWSKGGGGISSFWPQPDYQTGFGASLSGRNVPDVALDADPNNGYSICFNGSWPVYGGTSCAAPLWAAFLALVNQQRAINGLPLIGFSNPAIYRVAASAKNYLDFHDIREGGNGYYSAVVGYDNATGWGSFIATNLISDLSQAPSQSAQSFNAIYVADVTVPDGTTFNRNQSFNKIWQIKNTGSTTWGGSYRWTFDGGDRLGGPDSVNVPSVSPGSTWNPSVSLQAPANAGTYRGYWRMQAPDGHKFGDRVWVQIQVSNAGSDNAAYVADITVPDNTAFSSNQGFNKVWQIKNIGSTSWSSGYQWTFDGGDQMGGPNSISVPSVSPGNTWNPSINLQAPASAGTYKGYWRMQAPDGHRFGDRVWVQIQVSQGGANVTTFVSESDTALGADQPGFWRQGTPSYWHDATDAGDGGHMFWTYNNDNAHGTDDVGFWRPNLPNTQPYEVFVFIPRNHATTTQAHYTVYYANGQTDVVVNQNNYYDQWVSLGTYQFNNGTGGYLRLVDQTGEAYASKWIGFDSAQWQPRTSVPPPMAVTTVVSESDTAPYDGAPGFFRHGTPQYWHDAGVGDGGHMYWTYNNDSAHGSDDIGDWRPNLSVRAKYEVFAYIPNNYANTTQAHYTVYNADGQTEVYVDQSKYFNQWVSLGTYRFNSGTGGFLRLVDQTNEKYASKWVGFDTAQWQPRAGNANAPSNLQPSNDAVVNPNVNFTWQDNGMDDGNPSVNFQIQVWHVVNGQRADQVWSSDWQSGTSRGWSAPGPGEYEWVVQAGNGINQSAASGPARFVVPAPVPDAPTNLIASALSPVSIQLVWQDNSDIETGFKIERKSGSGVYLQVGTVSANVNQFTDTGLTPNTTYTYRVRAANDAGNSGYTNEASASTPADYSVISLTLAPNLIPGGNSTVGTIVLSGPALSSGSVISLRSSNTVAVVPTTVMVPPGASTATFTVNTQPVAVNTPMSITAANSVASTSAALTVQAPPVSHTHLLWNNSDGRVMLWSIAQDGSFTLNGFGPYTDNAPQNKWSATAVATGPDGKSHLLWNNTDGRVMLWTVDDAGNFTLAGYGPYTDGAPQNKWSATAVSVGPDNVVHLLWNNTDNRVMLWNVAPDFTFTLAGFGPYTDNAPQNKWRATALATGPDNVSRIVWNNTDNRVMLWKVDSSFNFTLAGYGPYTDGAPGNLWSAAGVSVGPDNLTHLLWSNTDRRAMFWNVDSSFNFTLAGYGPYTDGAPQNLWYATALATGPDGLSHVLWDNTDYRAMLWGVDNAFNFTVAGYGPYTDNAPGNLWSATAISAGP